MNIKDLMNDAELMKTLKEVENLPVMEGMQRLLPVIQKLNLQPQDIAELTKQLMFENPMGQQRLNPLYEAKIAERVQFDGDAPELRTGDLPQGSSPAVPVNTNNQHPSLIGAELKTASVQVQTEMKALSENSTDLAVSSDPQGYQRGQMPVPIRVQSASLLSMTREEKKQNTWHFISTTQGRNSAVPLIERNLVKSLGVQVGKVDTLLYEWVVDISSGAESTHEGFDYIGLVSSIFERVLQEKFDNDLIIKVSSVNDIPSRKVGWALFTQEIL
jgi:hypothetical protein